MDHRTGIAEVTGSNPVEALIFFRLHLSSCLSWKIYRDDYSLLSVCVLLLCASILEKENEVREKESRLYTLKMRKQRNSEIRVNIRIAFKMFGRRVASLVKFYTKGKNVFGRARKSLGTSLVQHCSTCK